MADFDLGEEVNAKRMQVFIGAITYPDADTPVTLGGEWKLLQNARVLISHPIFREPTTSGGVATYTGAPDNTISGTLLFTRDEWNTANAGANKVAGLAALLAPGAGGEVIRKKWLVRFMDISSTLAAQTTIPTRNELLTFTDCQLSVVDISKSVEGAVKADITVICPGEPTTTTTD